VVVIKNVASAYIERWNFVLGAVFVIIVVFMPDGLVPGVARLARRVRVVLRSEARLATTAPRDETSR
jgi:branched-chain amino acid transport system permease protein